jgi:ABC-type lipoprotein release transport system permease subunit
MGRAVLVLAWRNLFRQRRRTLLLVIVVAFATAGTVFFWGFVDGFEHSVMAGHARFIGAPVLVMTVDQRADPDVEHALPDLGFVAELERHPAVAAAAPRLEFAGLGRTAYASAPLALRGVDPEREHLVSDIPRHVREGRMLHAHGEAILGVDLAERLDVRLGERLALDTSGIAGPRAAGLTVVGLIDSGMAFVDRGAVLIHLDQARELTGVSTATAVALDVPRGREEHIAAELDARLPAGVRAYGVRELLGPVREHFQAHRNRMLVIGGMFAVFAAMAVTSTVLVSVIERTREFGVIAALGLAPASLSAMAVAEAVLGTVLGYGLGLVAGYAVLWWLSTVNVLGPLLFASFDAAFASLGLSNEFYMALQPAYVGYATTTIVVAAVFAILVPARRLWRLEPASAMRVG